MRYSLRREHFFLVIIMLLGLFLRIHSLSIIPPSLSWDEVSIGYNAYSILKTGRDEHKRYMPLDAFAAYGDYKPPVSIYLTVPSIAIFGLNEFAVRLPSVLFGAATVMVTFFLVRQLLGGSETLALVSSLILAVSPWHIQLSRGGFEANIATFWLILGVWLVLASRTRPRLLIFCWIPFVAAIYTFNSARYFAPLLGIGMIVYCWKNITKHFGYLGVGIALSLLLLMPIVPHLLSKEARLRFIEVNIFTDLGIVETSNGRIAFDHDTLVAKIFHNRRLGYARSYLIHYFDNFEPWFLFIRGDGNPKFSIQDVGQLYFVDLPLIALGVYWMLRRHRSTAFLLLFWLLASIVPAATARETPHALRIENSLPTWQIFIACGAVFLSSFWSKSSKRWVITSILVLIYVANFSFYLHNYYEHYPKEFSAEWQYGYKEAIAYAKSVKSNYNSIVMTESIGRPYMYALFYEQYDPEAYWRSVNASFDAAGFYNVYGFDTYRFVRQGAGDLQDKTLYVLSPEYVPNNAKVLKTISALDGKPVLVIFEKA